MTKNKKVWVLSSVGLLSLLIVGGAVFGFTHHATKLSAQQTAYDAGAATEQSSGATADSPATTDTTGTANTQPSQPGPSLNAAGTPAASSLGQLNTSAGSNGANSSSSISPQSSGTTSSSASSSSSNVFDPSTFAQYSSKYQNDQDASFGDAQVGTGDTLTAGKTAVVYYRGWLTNGTLFDQSRTGSDGKLQTFSFTVGQHQVISGWEEGLVGMKVGGVRLLIVPPAAGYGATAQGSIPANSVLVFQVQLVAVQ